MKTPWRTHLYERLSGISTSGHVLDVGGERNAGYHECVGLAQERVTIANLNASAGDIVCDLEEGIPSPDAAYDHVLCINVLEHIFHYEHLLREMRRVIRPDGTVTIAVPFLIAYHPSPRDHWRFTGETLERIVKDAGFTDVRVEAVGTGVFSSLANLSYGILHFSVLRWCAKEMARALDKGVALVRSQSVYDVRHYPLGYIVRAKK